MTAKKQEPIRVLFLNSGLLGLLSFSKFVDQHLVQHPGLAVTQEVLTDQLTFAERIVRRILCQRLWHDGWLQVKNADLARWRAEWNTGLLAAGRLRRLERAGKVFDVIHFHRQAAAYALTRRMLRTASVVSIDCTQRCIVQTATTDWERWTYRPNASWDGRIFSRTQYVVSTSQWADKWMRAEYPQLSCPSRVMHGPGELESFDQAWVAERLSRSTATDYKPCFLFVGGDFPRKGGPALLEAWRRGGFKNRAVLKLVTNWPLSAESLPEGVVVVRKIESYSHEWREVYRSADVFVMPTENEAYGLVYLEAASAGLPCIGTDHNAIPELIVHGKTGLLVAPGDTDSLIDAMNRLLTSPTLRTDFGRAGRAHVEALADPKVYTEDLVQIFSEVVSRFTASQL